MKILSRLLTFVIILLAGSAAASDGQLDSGLLEKLEQAFADRGDQTAYFNAVANNKLADLALNHQLLTDHNEFVNYKLESSGITNQKSSGRCWLYAGLNVYTPNIMTRLGLSDIELSHAYLAFYDKLEKANMFLEQIIAFRAAPMSDRKLRIVLASPFGDGGWYSYFTGLIDKYGVVPAATMPETRQSSATGTINKLASRYLRGCAAELRRLHEAGQKVKALRQRKEEMLAEVYQLLALSYGEPPQKFEYRYEPKEDSLKNDVEVKEYTPRTFAKEFLGEEMPEFVALMNDPNRAYDLPYQGEWSRNMYEIDDFTLLNLPIEKLKHYTMKALLDSQLVWFACDVGKEHSKTEGLLASGLYQYDRLLGVNFELTKAERLAYGDGSATHAMAITGVDTTDSGDAAKWLVENSWGKKKGNDGFWYMYPQWFDDYVYVVIVDKRLLEADDLAKMDRTPIKSEMWDVLMQSLKTLE